MPNGWANSEFAARHDADEGEENAAYGFIFKCRSSLINVSSVEELLPQLL
jgi:hypothetical protein